MSDKIGEFEKEEESMKYKDVIRKAKHDDIHGRTKEHMTFIISPSKKVKVRFIFDWRYDKEDGFTYTEFSDFSGHTRYKEEERTWLENYCKHHYPDGHHMSY